MDTWTCLLLCHPTTKPPASSTKPGHAKGTLQGDARKEVTVGERHLENMNTMRRVGYKRFQEAYKELSQEELLLRQKVYNLYSGPGNPIHSPTPNLVEISPRFWFPVVFYLTLLRLLLLAFGS